MFVICFQFREQLNTCGLQVSAYALIGYGMNADQLFMFSWICGHMSQSSVFSIGTRINIGSSLRVEKLNC